MNRKARRRTAKLKAGVGDIIEIFEGYTANDEELGWYWCVRGPGSRNARAGIQEAFDTQQVHGPFKSRAAAEANAFGGEDVKIRDGGIWDPAWDKPQ